MYTRNGSFVTSLLDLSARGFFGIGVVRKGFYQFKKIVFGKEYWFFCYLA